MRKKIPEKVVTLHNCHLVVLQLVYKYSIYLLSKAIIYIRDCLRITTSEMLLSKKL